ncbi:MAG: hypothetical protein J2P37_36385, partial [Ktedonobacteraceae bacterium]|nr:hypothetical protein [Ktedonobacteraceae bacterium]
PVTQKLAVSAIFLLQALLIYFVLAQRFPLSGDDYSYLYQAKVFASGKLYAEDPLYDRALPFYDCLATKCFRDDQGRRFSQFSPGWPALLAVGVKLGVPWLVNPLLGALLVFLILEYVEQRMGKELVRVASLLLLLCFFLSYYAGSFRAHVATALFVFASFCLYDLAQRRPEHSKLCLLGAGALLGYSALIRYIDWVPLALWIGVSLLRRKRFADLMLFGIGFAPLASGNLVYDALLLGNPFQAPDLLYHRPGIGDRLAVSWNGLGLTIVRLANLLWAFPPVLLLVVLWRHYQASPKMKMYVALFSMNVAIYFFYPAGVAGPGPRYFLAYFPFLVLAVVDLYQRMSRDSRPIGRHLWNFAIVSLVVCSIAFVTEEAYTMYWRRDLERTVQHVSDGKKIFLLKTGTYHTAVSDLTRNPPVLSSADSLYFKWRNGPEQDELLKRFPGRNIFVYEYPGRLSRYGSTD